MCSGYENLEDRKEVRENAWSRPGWDQCVSRTGEIHLLYVLYRYYLLNMCLIQVRFTQFIPVLGSEFVRRKTWS